MGLHRGKACLRWLCAGLAAVSCAALADRLPVAQGVTRPLLEAGVRDATDSPEYDDKTRASLIEIYQRALGNLDDDDAHLQAIEGFAASVASAPRQLGAVRADLERLQGEPIPLPRPGSAEAATQALLEARAELLSEEADLNALRARLEEESQRPSAARRELTEAMDLLDSAGQKPKAAGGALVGAADLAQARSWLRETTERELSSRIQMLDQELISYAPRNELLKARSELQALVVARVRQQVAMLEAQLRGQRESEAVRMLQQAEAAQRAVQGQHPVLEETAQDNIDASRRLEQLARRIERFEARVAEIDQEARNVEESYQNLRQKLELAGMSRSLGHVLQDQYTSLPQRRGLQIELKRRDDEQTELALQKIAVDDHLKALGDKSQFSMGLLTDFQVRTRAETASGPLPPINMSALDDLLEQQREIYRQIQVAMSSYSGVLGEYSFMQRRLIDAVGGYEAYLVERLLWVRSLPSREFFTNLTELPSDFGKLLAPQDLREAVDILLGPGFFAPLQWLGVLVALLLLAARRPLRGRLRESSRLVGNPVKDSFRYTLQALAIVLLLVLPGPLLLASLALKLEFSNDPLLLSHALAVALFSAASSLFFLLLFFTICGPDGLGQRHFLWHQPALRPLRHELGRLIVPLIPLTFLLNLLFQLDAGGIAWDGLRLGLMACVLLLTGFFVRVLRRSGELMRALEKPKAYVSLVRLRRVWQALVVLVPLAMLVLLAAGYVYLAGMLLSSVIRSFWVVIVVVIVHQLCVRWLRITASRLNQQVLMANQARRIQEMSQFDPSQEVARGPPSPPEVDVLGLGRDTLRLVNAISTVVAVAGFALVWAQVLPALRFMDNVTVWHVGSLVPGAPVGRAISLADVGLALLVLGAAVFLYRKLPSMLELMLIQFTALAANERATAITLVRYLLIAVSIGAVVIMLGFEWARFQWLAAALGVGIGFGLQEILANFISGLIILFERPVRVGDRVTIGTVEGIVMRIQIRATTIVTWDRQELLVPNKSFITGPVLNWSLSDPISRLVVDVGVAHGTDVARAMALVAAAAEAEQKVLRDPQPLITLEQFGVNALEIRLRCYLDDLEARPVVRSRLYEAINAAFRKEGITVAFPQRDLHFDADRPLQIVLAGR